MSSSPLKSKPKLSHSQELQLPPWTFKSSQGQIQRHDHRPAPIHVLPPPQQHTAGQLPVLPLHLESELPPWAFDRIRSSSFSFGELNEAEGESSSNDGGNHSDSEITVVAKKRFSRAFYPAVDEALREYLFNKVAPNNLTDEEKRQWLISQKNEKRRNKLYETKHQDAYNAILSKPHIVALMAGKDVGHIRNFWIKRLESAISGTTRGLSSRIDDQNKLGLHLVFGSHCRERLSSLNEMMNGRPVTGVFGCEWDDRTIEEISFRKTEKALQLYAEHTGQAIKDILLGYSLKDFLDTFSCVEGLKDLDEIAYERAEEMTVALVVSEKGKLKWNDDTNTEWDWRDRMIRRLSNIIWLSAVNIIVFYQDVGKALKGNMCGLFPHPNDGDCLLSCLYETMEGEFCIGGGTVKQGLDPGNFQRPISTDGSYVVDIFGTMNPLVLDVNSKKNYSGRKGVKAGENDDDDILNEYKRIPMPGTNNQHVRKLMVTRKEGAAEGNSNLTTFYVTTRYGENDDTHSDKRKLWKLHRLNMTNIQNRKLGLHHNEMVRKYFERYFPSHFEQLKDGETFTSFEDIEQFQWGTDDTEYLKRRMERLKRKGWENVDTSCFSDEDHMVGRSEIWMNCPMFLLTCSHSFNQCLSLLRILYKDWCFAFGKKRYNTGND